jgi:hypothetical protein
LCWFNGRFVAQAIKTIAKLVTFTFFMSISKIRYLLSKQIFYLVIVLAFSLYTPNINAQVDSLKTDTTKVERYKPFVINDSLSTVNDSGEITRFKPDTAFFIPKTRRIIPAKSALYSMILPGLGQAYNGKYWKIPIIYSLLGTMYYFAADNHQKYEDFKYAYKNFNDPDQKPEWVRQIENSSYLKERMEFYKRNRDLNIVLGAVIYLFNILDANVDAHLMDFDVSEDLSLRIQPDINYYQAFEKKSNVSGFGIKFVLSLNR